MDVIFGKQNFRNEIVWAYRGGGTPKKDFGRRHDILLRYSKSNLYTFYPDTIRIPYQAEGIGRTDDAMWGKHRGTDRIYKPHPLGKVPEDWWPINIINANDPQRQRYPTQKPEELLERIIKASSQENEIVLDPFCGCGTSIAVAQRLNRRWIGIDIIYLAIKVIKDRLREAYHLEPYKHYEIYGEPKDIESAIQLASEDKWKFQSWDVSLVDKVRNYVDAKKGPDRSIDGVMYFADGNDHKKVIIQVKGGHNISVKDINELCHVIDREKAEIGIFITLYKPTSNMKREAVEKGDYKSIAGKRYPKIQILTIEELFEGSQPKIPQAVDVDKAAPKHIKKPDDLF
jgi:site-specific DNA-methyltransferase (adenine-specific)